MTPETKITLYFPPSAKVNLGYMKIKIETKKIEYAD